MKNDLAAMRIRGHRVLRGCVLVVAGLVLAAPLFGQSPVSAGGDPLERVMQAADRGLEYLYKIQEDDGGWPSPGYGKNVACSSLPILAFLARGHTPGRGPYAEALERATTFLISCSADSGLLAHGGGPPMYQHGLGTLALAELYGMTRRPDVKQKLEAAVNLIVRTQNDAGGWRYNPVKADADMSVTVMQIVGLKAAMNAGIKVPETTIQYGIKYIKASACPGGGFGYTPGAGPGAGASPAGTLSLQMCGEFDAPEVQRGLTYQSNVSLAFGAGWQFFYANYYAAQAMNQAGGVYWLEWMPKMRASLLGSQSADGSWPSDNTGTAFSTAIACLILSIDCHYLPIYQR